MGWCQWWNYVHFLSTEELENKPLFNHIHSNIKLSFLLNVTNNYIKKLLLKSNVFKLLSIRRTVNRKMISLRKNVYSNSVRSITITKKDGYRKKNICFYLSVANDGCRPSESCRRFQNELRVNRKAENIVDVIDDA